MCNNVTSKENTVNDEPAFLGQEGWSDSSLAGPSVGNITGNGTPPIMKTKVITKASVKSMAAFKEPTSGRFHPPLSYLVLVTSSSSFFPSYLPQNSSILSTILISIEPSTSLLYSGLYKRPYAVLLLVLSSCTKALTFIHFIAAYLEYDKGRNIFKSNLVLAKQGPRTVAVIKSNYQDSIAKYNQIFLVQFLYHLSGLQYRLDLLTWPNLSSIWLHVRALLKKIH